MAAGRTARIGLTLGAGAVALGGVALTAGSSSASTPDIGPDAVELKAVTTQSGESDTGRKGPSLGDRFTFAEDLFYWKGDRRIGTDGVDCVITFVARKAPAESESQCVGTLRMARGQIAVQGLVRHLGKADSVVAVIGGTGEFRGTSGNLTIHQVDSKTSKLTLKLDDAWSDGIDGVEGVTVHPRDEKPRG